MDYISRDQSFEPSRRICPFLWNFYVCTVFYGIQYRTVIRGQIRHILVGYRHPYCMYTLFCHKIHDWHLGSNGRNIENIELSLSEILSVYLVDNCICQLQLPATNTGYLVGFRGRTTLIAICGKFATVSRGIWQTGLWNLEKFAAENCVPYIPDCWVTDYWTIRLTD